MITQWVITQWVITQPQLSRPCQVPVCQWGDWQDSLFPNIFSRAAFTPCLIPCLLPRGPAHGSEPAFPGSLCSGFPGTGRIPLSVAVRSMVLALGSPLPLCTEKGERRARLCPDGVSKKEPVLSPPLSPVTSSVISVSAGSGGSSWPWHGVLPPLGTHLRGSFLGANRALLEQKGWAVAPVSRCGSCCCVEGGKPLLRAAGVPSVRERCQGSGGGTSQTSTCGEICTALEMCWGKRVSQCLHAMGTRTDGSGGVSGLWTDWDEE